MTTERKRNIRRNVSSAQISTVADVKGRDSVGPSITMAELLVEVKRLGNKTLGQVRDDARLSFDMRTFFAAFCAKMPKGEHTEITTLGEMAQKKGILTVMLPMNLKQDLAGTYYQQARSMESNSQNYSESEVTSMYEKAAELGDCQALTALGMRYFDGKGATVDKSKAVKKFKEAAEKGDARGQFHYGMSLMGNDPEMEIAFDKKRGFQWLIKAAQQNDTDAIWQVAFCHREGFTDESGENLEADGTQAISWFKKFFEVAKNGEALSEIGYIYEHGLGGIAANPMLAKNFYERACGMDKKKPGGMGSGEVISLSADAAFRLGRLYDEREDFDKAIQAYQRAIVINPKHRMAHGFLANHFYSNPKHKNIKKAAEHYKIFSAEGPVRSQYVPTRSQCVLNRMTYTLGRILFYGEGDVPKDEARGVSYMKLAMQGEEGCSDALITMGNLYFWGRPDLGIPQNIKESIHCLEQAYRQQVAMDPFHKSNAALALALLHLSHVPEKPADIDSAKRYLRFAFLKGNFAAQLHLIRLLGSENEDLGNLLLMGGDETPSGKEERLYGLLRQLADTYSYFSEVSEQGNREDKIKAELQILKSAYDTLEEAFNRARSEASNPDPEFERYIACIKGQLSTLEKSKEQWAAIEGFTLEAKSGAVAQAPRENKDPIPTNSTELEEDSEDSEEDMSDEEPDESKDSSSSTTLGPVANQPSAVHTLTRELQQLEQILLASRETRIDDLTIRKGALLHGISRVLRNSAENFRDAPSPWSGLRDVNAQRASDYFLHHDLFPEWESCLAAEQLPLVQSLERLAEDLIKHYKDKIAQISVGRTSAACLRTIDSAVLRDSLEKDIIHFDLDAKIKQYKDKSSTATGRRRGNNILLNAFWLHLAGQADIAFRKIKDTNPSRYKRERMASIRADIKKFAWWIRHPKVPKTFTMLAKELQDAQRKQKRQRTFEEIPPSLFVEDRPPFSLRALAKVAGNAEGTMESKNIKGDSKAESGPVTSTAAATLAFPSVARFVGGVGAAKKAAKSSSSSSSAVASTSSTTAAPTNYH